MSLLGRFQSVYDITNDLNRLIAVGVLILIDLTSGIDYNGLPVSPGDDDGWRWLDPSMLPDRLFPLDNEVVNSLEFLITFKYFMCTFKDIGVRERCIKVRLYAVPMDQPYSRTIESWRSRFRGSNRLQRLFRQAWSCLIRYTDFSDDQWCLNYLQFPCALVSASLATSNANQISDSQMKRWINRMPCYLSKNPGHESLQSKLQTLYSSIKSPDLTKYESYAQHPKSNIQPPNYAMVISRLLCASASGTAAVEGVNTVLFQFQIRSLCKMYEKETLTAFDTLPSFVRIQGPRNNQYYFDLIKIRFCADREVYALPKGGILAENMGLGKTLICLSLICLTKHEVSKVPEELMIHVPSTNITSVKTLAEISRDAVNASSLPWTYYQDDLPASIIKYMEQVPGSFKISLFDPTMQGRMTRQETFKQETLDSENLGEGIIYKTLYKCSTTLIVVPENLFHQWNDEMKRHLRSGYLKVLFILSQFKRRHVTALATFQDYIPQDPTQFVHNDVVLVLASVLARLLDTVDDNLLFKVYWKRLIVDEGHSMNSKNSRLSQLCKELYAERRWAVTGTPTSGLTRLQMDEEQFQDVSASPTKKSRYTVKNDFNAKEDLTKLGVTIGSFLKVEPFHSQPKYWLESIMKPMISNSVHSLLSLNQLLSALVVRHDLKEVEKELELPPLRHVPVFLEPSFHNTLSVNLFTAVLAVNAVTSERTDTDYMFHPTNRQQLRRLITNMQRATFHWTGFKPEDIRTLIDICKAALEKASKGKSLYGTQDIQLLKKSLEISKMALLNDRWKALALLHEMGYYIGGLPRVFTKLFGTGIVETNHVNEQDISVFGAPHLHSVQEFFYKNRFMDFSDAESVQTKLETVADPFWEHYWNDVSKRNSERFNKLDASHFVSRTQTVGVSDLPNEMASRHSKEENYIKDLTVEREVPPGLQDLSFHHIKQAKILGTASAKLSYLGARLMENSRMGVKSLVFFEFEDSAYYLSELLDVLGVEYILYATFVNPAERATNLTKFSAFPSGQGNGVSLIMDLKLAAHGLNITAATHVYFISPVWLRSVEAQAIKRAHRIGQTKPVQVETLILKGTLEEEIYRHRSQDTERTEKEQKFVIDDAGMQEFILKHSFIPQLVSDSEFAPFSAQARGLLSKDSNDVADDSLQNHFCVNHEEMRDWTVFLFTESNLAKMNSARNTKLNKKYVRDQFLKRFADDLEEVTNNRTRSVHKTDSPRKKVRF